MKSLAHINNTHYEHLLDRLHLSHSWRALHSLLLLWREIRAGYYCGRGQSVSERWERQLDCSQWLNGIQRWVILLLHLHFVSSSPSWITFLLSLPQHSVSIQQHINWISKKKNIFTLQAEYHKVVKGADIVWKMTQTVTVGVCIHGHIKTHLLAQFMWTLTDMGRWWNLLHMDPCTTQKWKV